MKTNRIIQSMLFSFLILGLFAAMARNAYGFTLIGISCLGLTALYLIQFVWKLIEDYATLARKDIMTLTELFLLASLFMLFGLRAFYVYLTYGEFIFIGACTLLIILYGLTGFEIFNQTKKESSGLALDMISFYSSVLLFILSLVTNGTTWSGSFGIAGLLIAIPFLVSIGRRKRHDHLNNPTTSLQFVIASANKAGILFIFFLSSMVYAGLTHFHIIPIIQNADRPKAYIELIDKFERGKELPVGGQYDYERYKAAMDKFLERHDAPGK
jgi:hypothetical protein